VTVKQIEARMAEEQRRVSVKFETAKQIRALLDTARKAYGTGDYVDEFEESILELVTELEVSS
jgi:hypothetical protein